MRKFVVAETDAGIRADVFIAAKYPAFTRSSLEALFDKKLVQFNSIMAKPAQRLKVGDTISIDESLLNTKPSTIDLPVIYEDSDAVVIDKPSGVLTHSKGALNTEATVASFLADKIDDKSLRGNRAGVVHRLDRDTSGLIIGAKTALALKSLQAQFSKRKVKKSYIAIVEGRPSPPAAIIEAPIMRNPSKPQTFKVGSSGKPAITEYKILKSFERSGHKYSLVELTPQTGRTHQLRVHMAYIHHPIVGDRVYGRIGAGLMLHASSLELNLPNGHHKVFSSPLPRRIAEF